MRLLSMIFGDNRRAAEMEIQRDNAILAERARMNQSLNAMSSGSRVMQNMAGMMRIMAINSRIRDDAE